MKKLIACSLLILTSLPACSGESANTVSTVGSEARSYLTSATYTTLNVEIQAVSGFEISASAKTALQSFLQVRLNKPGGINIVTDTSIAAQGGSPYSSSKVSQIEGSNRQLSSNGTTLNAYVLVLEGNSISDSGTNRVLGTAYGATSIVLFGGSIHALSGGLGQPSRAVTETAILEHEFGHLMGLVNTGTAQVIDHHDSAHPGHCTNTSCLMHWQIDQGDFIGNLLGGTVPSLDANCISDLQAAGGK